MSEKKILFSDYKKIKDDFKNVISNFNGINNIYDNPTPISFPNLNTKGQSTYIEQGYRDKKNLLFNNENSLSIEKKSSQSGTLNVKKGFYHLVLIGAGSGSILLDYHQSSNMNKKYYLRTGNAGSFVDVILCFYSDGVLKYKIGKGGDSYKGTPENNNTYYSIEGDTSEIYFNDVLVIKCMGGNASSIKKVNNNCIIMNSTGGNFDNESYIKIVNESKNGASGFGDSIVNNIEKDYICPYTKETYHYGKGGDISINGDVENGQDGYLLLKSVDPKELEYLVDEIEFESEIIHTLGNENNVRRNLKNGLEKIYSKISSDETLIPDSCNIIGVETIEDVNNLKKYSQIKDILEQGKNIDMKIYSTEVGYLSEVAQSKKDGCFSKDEYIITYDIDTKRRLLLSDFIKEDNYDYDLQKLNRLKEYVAKKDSWFDMNGYCQRSCQINCQTVAQVSNDVNKVSYKFNYYFGKNDPNARFYIDVYKNNQLFKTIQKKIPIQVIGNEKWVSEQEFLSQKTSKIVILENVEYESQIDGNWSWTLEKQLWKNEVELYDGTIKYSTIELIFPNNVIYIDDEINCEFHPINIDIREGGAQVNLNGFDDNYNYYDYSNFFEIESFDEYNRNDFYAVNVFTCYGLIKIPKS